MLLARLPRLKQLDDVMVNRKGCSDDDDDDDDDDDEDSNGAVNIGNAADTRHRILSGTQREMGLAKIYLYTKFDISSFTRSRFTEGVLKFNFLVTGL